MEIENISCFAILKDVFFEYTLELLRGTRLLIAPRATKKRLIQRQLNNNIITVKNKIYCQSI